MQRADHLEFLVNFELIVPYMSRTITMTFGDNLEDPVEMLSVEVLNFALGLGYSSAIFRACG